MILTIGIVGSEARKFTHETEAKARDLITELIRPYDRVVSGGCHLGGVDIYAREIALAQGKLFVEHKPGILQWGGPDGYKERNLRIGADSHRVVCITVRDLPPSYVGMRFKTCYHCQKWGLPFDHVKSGGCWTVREAVMRYDRQGETIVI